MNDLPSLDAVEIAARVRARQLSPVEATRAALDQIARLDPELNAFRLVREEAALAEAAQLQSRDLSSMPLAGVPVAIKDNVDVAGESTRHGSRATSETPAAVDDELVRRLRQAGCVVVGKTSMPELAIFPFTEPEAFGITRNPWNPERTPGGSSGGSAAAVAAGMVPFALGSDGGGSIRIPAACCGLFGIKPTRGLVPVPGPRAEHWHGLTASGPLARGVADAAAMLAVLAGRPDLAEVKPAGRLRIAVSLKGAVLTSRLGEEMRGAIEDVSSVLAEAGHEVRRSDPPYPPTLPVAFMRRYLSGIAMDAEGLDPGRLERNTVAMARWGRRLRGLGDPDLAGEGWRGKALSWFGDLDLLLAPMIASPAPPVGRWKGKGWFATTNGVAGWMGYAPPWNMAGFPAASVPAGTSKAGLPLAVQLVAAPGGEALILAVAAQLERLHAWRRLAPVAAAR